jgi:hypothetical protein
MPRAVSYAIEFAILGIGGAGGLLRQLRIEADDGSRPIFFLTNLVFFLFLNSHNIVLGESVEIHELELALVMLARMSPILGIQSLGVGIDDGPLYRLVFRDFVGVVSKVDGAERMGATHQRVTHDEVTGFLFRFHSYPVHLIHHSFENRWCVGIGFARSLERRKEKGLCSSGVASFRFGDILCHIADNLSDINGKSEINIRLPYFEQRSRVAVKPSIISLGENFNCFFYLTRPRLLFNNL